MFAMALASAGCDSRPTSWDGVKGDTRFAENKGIFAAIRGTTQFTLYEGLPHQGFERQILAEEKQRKLTVTLDNYPFYAKPLTMSAADAIRLKAILSDERSFQQWRGQSKCGGFHPDYLAEYSHNGTVYRVLICFNCKEVIVYGPNGSSVRCHFEVGTEYVLEPLLKKYRQSRPTFEEWVRRQSRP
jgi:hypothetical protein